MTAHKDYAMDLMKVSFFKLTHLSLQAKMITGFNPSS